MLESYSQLCVDNRISDYQYVVMDTDVETSNTDAEKYALTTLHTDQKKFMEEEVSIYGISEDSRYITEEIPVGEVLISNGYADKFHVKAGDTITLKDNITDTYYDFQVAGSYTYDAAIAVFMPIADYREMFKESDDFFTGYFSNEELTDLDEDDIAAVITETDLRKLATQMEISVGDFMPLMAAFGVIMFLLLMYILSKQIIEKNANSIAMTKILGFKDGEIGKLYIVATSIVIVLSLLVSIPLIEIALAWICENYLYTEITGYFPLDIAPGCYVKMVVLGIVSYAAIAILQMLKIKKIPKAEALKNME